MLVIILCVAFSSSCHAYEFAEKWTKADTALQATFISLGLIDWAQTRWMAKQDWYWKDTHHIEMNPFLGRKPHQDKADFLIPVGLVLHTVVAMALPSSYKIKGFDIMPRRTWQLIFIGAELGAVGNNFNIGARIGF
jgi:hypothetical protein